MYQKILVSVALQGEENLSSYAEAAREAAVGMAKGANSCLHVLTVYDYDEITSTQIPPDLPSDVAVRYREDRMRRIDEEVKKKMEAFVSGINVLGVSATDLIKLGDPKDLIVEVAEEIEADLIIIGSHSKRNIFDIGLGGTANAVAKKAPCPVMMMSPTKK